MLIYLPRPIYSRNTIVGIGGLVVVFLGSMFLKTLNMYSRVKSLLKTSILTYLHRDHLTYSIFNYTHCLLFLPHHVAELKLTEQLYKS